jgi:hypothetical protein
MRPLINGGTLGGPKHVTPHHDLVALVHPPVIRGEVSAIYVARRQDGSFLVGGPAFTDESSSEFLEVSFDDLMRIDAGLMPPFPISATFQLGTAPPEGTSQNRGPTASFRSVHCFLSGTTPGQVSRTLSAKNAEAQS